MKPSRLLVAVLPAALLAACGGPGTSTSSFTDAAPSYQALSMDLTTSDAATPSTLAAVTAGDADVALVGPDACHPHLFLRTHDVVQRVNRHLWHFLRHVDAVLRRNPDVDTGSSRVWERAVDGLDVKFTISRTGEVFSWTLEMKKQGDTAFVTVFSGDIDRTDAQGPHQGKGGMTLDLTKLAGVTGQDVAGVLSAQFETFTETRKVVVDAAGVVWDADAYLPALRQPRDGHYVFFREPGKGGSIKIEEQMVFACPSNLESVPADVKLVSRWFKTDSGSVHGRSDALMTGGQLPAEYRVAGVTCHQGERDGVDQIEGYWLMKEEDGQGQTLAGGAVGGGPETCDPLLNPPSGTVPTLDDSSNDFDMSGIVFSGSDPYPFPNM